MINWVADLTVECIAICNKSVAISYQTQKRNDSEKVTPVLVQDQCDLFSQIKDS